MDELKQLIVCNIEQIETISELFYQQKNLEANQHIVLFTQELAKTLDKLHKEKAVLQGQGIVVDEESLTDKLKEAMQAMEEKDYILLGDILQYEIGEQLQGYLR